MTIGYWTWFPYAVAVLELCAAAVHVYAGHYRVAFIWAGVAASNFAFAGMK